MTAPLAQYPSTCIPKLFYFEGIGAMHRKLQLTVKKIQKVTAAAGAVHTYYLFRHWFCCQLFGNVSDAVVGLTKFVNATKVNKNTTIKK